jgi:hypothetical protein
VLERRYDEYDLHSGLASYVGKDRADRLVVEELGHILRAGDLNDEDADGKDARERLRDFIRKDVEAIGGIAVHDFDTFMGRHRDGALHQWIGALQTDSSITRAALSYKVATTAAAKKAAAGTKRRRDFSDSGSDSGF